MKASFGGKKPYYTEFEMAEDISPDPFSEINSTMAKSLQLPVRSVADKNHRKYKHSKIKENKENS